MNPWTKSYIKSLCLTLGRYLQVATVPYKKRPDGKRAIDLNAGFAGSLRRMMQKQDPKGICDTPHYIRAGFSGFTTRKVTR